MTASTTNLTKLATLASKHWIDHFSTSKLVHSKTGIKVHVLGSATLNHPSFFNASINTLNHLKPSIVALSSPASIADSLSTIANVLARDSAANSNKLVPLVAEAAASAYSASAKAKLEFIHNKDLDTAEEMAKSAALVKQRTEQTHQDHVQIPQLNDNDSGPSLDVQKASIQDANLVLQERLTHLFESHDISQDRLRQLKQDAWELDESGNSRNIDVQSLIMGPVFYREYNAILNSWVKEFPAATAKFGVFGMLKRVLMRKCEGGVKEG
ncbi:hypothetical protein BCR33DRAFT_722552 [Rhizoclosmatium globosum]|uniref:Uncharacterized protein n=1 Tax=Rhizoclosmatium globosum TaxID=329046 RepID=A0A1Y2BKC4_9FUNG|nr:hypothetical protein BCR33DRAFT_722552 [Rhizoclosmatium globosum]|eukprot:ORY35209.1 hypothetical protein BCR33DRAFT_722552 [Rhizoclosmatium globosum]